MKMQNPQPVQPLLNDLQLMAMMAARIAVPGGTIEEAVDSAEEIVLLIVTRDMEHRALHADAVDGCYNCVFRKSRAEVEAKVAELAKSQPRIVQP